MKRSGLSPEMPLLQTNLWEKQKREGNRPNCTSTYSGWVAHSCNPRISLGMGPAWARQPRLGEDLVLKTNRLERWFSGQSSAVLTEELTWVPPPTCLQFQGI